MQLSTIYEFAFLCTPKCASTSIEAAIRPHCNIQLSGHPDIKHMTADFYTNHILSAFEQLLPSTKIESFCLIRNPLDWLSSWYRYRMKDEFRDPNHNRYHSFTGNVSYNEFIETYLSPGKRPYFANLPTQYHFMKLANGEIGVDKIFPLERLDLVREFLSKKIGKEIAFPSLNTSPEMDIGLDDKLEERLRQHLCVDITLYDFIKSHGFYDKTLHLEKLSHLLKTSHETCRPVNFYDKTLDLKKLSPLLETSHEACRPVKPKKGRNRIKSIAARILATVRGRNISS